MTNFHLYHTNVSDALDLKECFFFRDHLGDTFQINKYIGRSGYRSVGDFLMDRVW